MELELIYSQIAYEKARHNMEVCHLDCLKIQEEIAHIKSLAELKDKKDALLDSCSSNNLSKYKPIRYSNSQLDIL